MTTGKDTITVGIRDLKISQLIKDDATGVEYGAPVDIPGVKEVTIALIKDEKELTGDGVILDTFDKRKGYDVTFKNAQFSQAVMDIINGSTSTESGTESAKIYTTPDKSSDTSNYFALEFAPEKAVGQKDYHRVLFKISGNYQEEFAEEDYMVCNFTGKGVARTYDKQFGERKLYDALTEIAQIPVITKA
jgi:phi13 family phage major tail protein